MNGQSTVVLDLAGAPIDHFVGITRSFRFAREAIGNCRAGVADAACAFASARLCGSRDQPAGLVAAVRRPPLVGSAVSRRLAPP